MRPLMVIALVALAASSFTGAARASDWVYVISTHDLSADISADKNSINRMGDEAHIWTKWTFAQPQREPGLTSKPFRTKMLRFAFRCTPREKAVVSYIVYADLEMTERLVYQKLSSDSEYTEWSDVIPDTINEQVMQIACATS